MSEVYLSIACLVALLALAHGTYEERLGSYDAVDVVACCFTCLNEVASVRDVIFVKKQVIYLKAPSTATLLCAIARLYLHIIIISTYQNAVIFK